VIDGYGKFVGKRGNQIVVKLKGKIIDYFLAEDLDQVIITGKGAIGFDALNLLAENGVDLIILNWKGEVSSRLSFPELRTVSTRREQYLAYNDHRSGYLSKQFVFAKIKNQYAILGTLAKARAENNPRLSEKLVRSREKISKLLSKIQKIEEKPIDFIRNELTGLEGNASSIYWNSIINIIDPDLGFSGRSGRRAKDGVNAMLNYGYGILMGEVWRAVYYAGLDPYGGFLHVDRPGRPSLVLDLMEEFRQQIVDKVVFKLINKRMVKREDFSLQENFCRLSDKSRKLLISKILEKFESYIRVKNIRIKWSDLIIKQARQIAKFLREEDEYNGFFLRW